MKKEVFVTILFFCLTILIAKPDSFPEDKSLKEVYDLSSRNFNYGSTVSEEYLLTLCQRMEALTRSKKDYENLFFIQQITVNAYCLKGDVGLAVNHAQLMYAEAKKLNDKLGLVLSIQAIANTYIHSNLNKKALATFDEAWELIAGTDYNLFKVRIRLQQVHVCMLMDDTVNMLHYLTEVAHILENSKIPNEEVYSFYIKCYQSFYNIAVADKKSALTSLLELQIYKIDKILFNRWYYFLMCKYYEMIGDYETALLYCDSTQQVVKHGHNLNEYKKLMLVQASLLSKNNKKNDACDMYNKARLLTDSLNMESYSMQVDSLHVTYWVDKMELENMKMHNDFMKGSIICAVLVLLIAILLIYLAYKKNRMLRNSRTELEKARLETAESIKSKSMFLSNMSHELRTPLNAIVGFADLLSQDIAENIEEKQQFAERVQQNADLLMKLFNDVADLSALKDKNIQFVFQTCDIISLCCNVIHTIDKVKRTDAKLQFVTDLSQVELYTDSGRLQQVLINLLINATKFTQEGSITLVLEKNEEKNELVFIVKDTGCGIPLEKQPHIFERFEKLHEGVQGAGLGLSICQLIIEHIGGRIWIDATYTQGACFVFTHPLTQKK